MMPTKLVLSIAEAAEVLGVSDDLIYELTARGELPCLRLGRRRSSPLLLSRRSLTGASRGSRSTLGGRWRRRRTDEAREEIGGGAVGRRAS
jgi:excisionase family DNA binding protein